MKKLTTLCLLTGLLACLHSNLHGTPYASAVTNDAGTIRFVLNEDADNVTVLLDSGTITNDLGTLFRGPQSFDLAGATNFQILVSKSSPNGFTHLTGAFSTLNNLRYPRGTILQLSTDTDPVLSFNLPRGLTVNQNPKSPYFGRIYVANSSAGTVTSNATARVVGDGIYVLNPDLTAALGTEFGPLDGGLAGEFTAGGTASPYRLTIGEDDNLYISDWSDANGTLFVTDPDLTFGSGQNVLPGLKGASVPVGLDRVHGSINQAVVEGSLAAGNLTVYTIDEDLQEDRLTATVNQLNSLWRYDIGGSLPPIYNGDPGSIVMPQKLWTPGGRAGINNFAQTMDMDRGASGHFYIIDNRQNNGGTSGLIVLNPDGTLAWNSSATTRDITTSNTLDYCFFAYGVSVSVDQKYVVVNRLDSRCVLVPLTNNVPYLPASTVLLTFPTANIGRAVRFDAAGNLYMVTTSLQMMRVFSPGGTTLAVTGGDTTGTNGTFRLVTAPVFRQNPATQFVDQGGSLQLVSFVEGMGEVAYQWQLHGTNLPGATDSVYTKPDFGEADQGPYTLVASNQLGVATSTAGIVTLTPPPVLETPVLLSPSELVISWSSVSNRTYRLEYINDLSTGFWIQAGTDIVATGSTASLTNDPAITTTPVFFRVSRLP